MQYGIVLVAVLIGPHFDKYIST